MEIVAVNDVHLGGDLQWNAGPASNAGGHWNALKINSKTLFIENAVFSRQTRKATTATNLAHYAKVKFSAA
ncbi:MAG: hypothetical protein ACLQU2_34290 [Candidatus Binataceae bacterium]